MFKEVARSLLISLKDVQREKNLSCSNKE